MIKFFRNIRKNLLSQNRLSKYLIYAVGEIVLVVLGILIALQINNFNETKKQKLKEIEILKTIAESLNEDKVRLESVIPYNNRIRNSIDILLEHINSNLSYHDSLKYHFGNAISYWTFSHQTSPFETLKSEGVNLISNKELRKDIIQIYDVYNYTIDEQSANYRRIIENTFQNVLNTRFESFWDSSYEDYMFKRENNEDVTTLDIQLEMIPHDYEALKKDKEFIYFLRSLKNINSWYMDRVFRLNLMRIKKLEEDITSELKILES